MIGESGEMYLETILILEKKSGKVRSVDVSAYMDYSKPSVSRAMGILKNENYIRIDRSGSITLTDKGRVLAETVYERHTVLAELLKSIGVSERTAIGDACRVEHVISDETFQAIKRSVKK